MAYHAVAILSGGRQKTLPNKSEEQMLSQIIMPFAANGVVTAKWGSSVQSYQVLELRVYQTKESWDKKAGAFTDLVKGKKNIFSCFENQAKQLLAKNKTRIFLVTPIQGTKHGDQEQQRILKEFDDRFESVEAVLSGFGGIAIRIDREHPLEDLVTTIKRQIRDAQFVIADLTDERQSCYFEAGFAEALGKPIIYVASKNSVMHPGTATKIHFDIHMNVQYFTNHSELKEKLKAVIEKNHDRLFQEEDKRSNLSVDLKL
jgi:nucleoside 2-deoxyribosyltransferase